MWKADRAISYHEVRSSGGLSKAYLLILVYGRRAMTLEFSQALRKAMR